MTGFYIRATLALYGLKTKVSLIGKVVILAYFFLEGGGINLPLPFTRGGVRGKTRPHGFSNKKFGGVLNRLP